MMHQNKFIVAVKTATGSVLREHGEIVYLPFGHEYSILLKNLNSVRALVSVSIDGVDVGGGSQFVISPNSSIDLERFVSQTAMGAGNRFKFIERSASVEDHRGIGALDGIVRVEVWYEKPYPVYTPTPRLGSGTWPNNHGYGYDNSRGTLRGGPTFGTLGGNASLASGEVYCSGVTQASYVAKSGDNMAGQLQNTVTAQSVAGITVPGSISTQEFHTAASFPTEAQSTVITLALMGETETAKKVIAPITVKQKRVCVTCGKTNRATNKFCDSCGTSLQIIT